MQSNIEYEALVGDAGLEVAAPQHDEQAKRKIINRMRRAQGQLAAVIDAMENDAHCRDVVQQLAAVSKALDRAGFLVISSALEQCIAEEASEQQGSAEGAGAPSGAASRTELEKLFLSLA